jgi:hypothetical protein
VLSSEQSARLEGIYKDYEEFSVASERSASRLPTALARLYLRMGAGTVWWAEVVEGEVVEVMSLYNDPTTERPLSRLEHTLCLSRKSSPRCTWRSESFYER